MMKALMRCLLGISLLGSGILTACAAQKEQAAESSVETVAYRVAIHNELSENIRYRYLRLAPQDRNPLPQDPQPQATLDLSWVFETIPPGESTNLSLKPGKKLTLLTPKIGNTTDHTFTVDKAMDLYVTATGIYAQKNGARILIHIDQ